MKFRGLLSGFVSLRVLRHAAEHAIYGQSLVNELARHGYKLSPGTLSPMPDVIERPLIPPCFLLLNQAPACELALTAFQPLRGFADGG